MDKTIHNKLTAKNTLLSPYASGHGDGEGLFATLRLEKKILERLSSELLQPRQQAVDAILQMARKMGTSLCLGNILN
jgi:hypothetical protein